MAGPNTISLTRTERYSNLRAEEHSQMRRDCVFTDFTICTPENKFPCHKVMVAALSPVLKSMLTSNMVEITKGEVLLPNIRGESLDLVLNYIYGGQISFDTSQLMDMLKASHYLQIQELIEMCVGEAPAIFTPQTVLSWLELGQKLELDDLQAHSIQFMIENFIGVLNEPAFLSFSIVGVQDYFSFLQGPNTNHDGMLSAAMRWVSHDTANRTQHLEELMEKVSLEKCSLPVLNETIEKHGALVGSSLSTLNMITNVMHHLKAAQKMLVVGGVVGQSVSRICWKINERHQLDKLTEIPADDLVRWNSVCATEGGFIISGGQGSDICYIYTAATMSWRRMRKMLRKRWCHGSICIKGVLYVLGGWVSASISTNSVDCLALTQGHWEAGPNLPQSVGIPKVAEINDRLYLLNSETRKLYQLDVDSKVWTEQAPIPDCDEEASMVSARGKLAVMGGRARICALYDPTTDVWTELQKPKHEHQVGALVNFDDRLLLMGGQVWSNGTDEVEEYNLDDGTWSATDIKMPADLWGHYALVLVLDSPHNG